MQNKSKKELLKEALMEADGEQVSLDILNDLIEHVNIDQWIIEELSKE